LGRPVALCDGKTGRRNGKWVLSGGNAPEAVREEKAPKGESQERCRCETEPARVRKGVSRQEGNQTLKADRSGRSCPCEVDLPIQYVL